MNEVRVFMCVGKGGAGKSTTAVLMASTRLEDTRSPRSEKAGRASWIRRAQEQPWLRGSNNLKKGGSRG